MNSFPGGSYIFSRESLINLHLFFETGLGGRSKSNLIRSHSATNFGRSPEKIDDWKEGPFIFWKVFLKKGFCC